MVGREIARHLRPSRVVVRVVLHELSLGVEVVLPRIPSYVHGIIDLLHLKDLFRDGVFLPCKGERHIVIGLCKGNLPLHFPVFIKAPVHGTSETASLKIHSRQHYTNVSARPPDKCVLPGSIMQFFPHYPQSYAQELPGSPVSSSFFRLFFHCRITPECYNGHSSDSHTDCPA